MLAVAVLSTILAVTGEPPFGGGAAGPRWFGMSFGTPVVTYRQRLGDPLFVDTSIPSERKARFWVASGPPVFLLVSERHGAVTGIEAVAEAPLTGPVVSVEADPSGVVLGSTQLLAGQPEFATKERLQGLMAVTERRDLLREALAQRLGSGLTITIGAEHADPKLAPFTLVTSSYRVGPLSGVIGVMGPTRMPYDKIVALVDHTSRLVGELLA